MAIAAVKVIYERALAAFPLTHFLWLTYTRYLEAHLKIPTVINAVFARAVRNTPWVGVMWARALQALERSGAPEEEQAAVYQRATAAGLQVRESSTTRLHGGAPDLSSNGWSRTAMDPSNAYATHFSAFQAMPLPNRLVCMSHVHHMSQPLMAQRNGVSPFDLCQLPAEYGGLHGGPAGAPGCSAAQGP